MAWLLSDRRSAELDALLNKTRFGTASGMPEDLDYRLPSARTYEINLDTDLPPASFSIEGNRLILGQATGFLWKREAQPNEDNSQDPDNPTTAQMIPYRDEDGNCVKVRVFNSTLDTFPSCAFVSAEQDTTGDLFVQRTVSQVLVINKPPTTTTSNPQRCTGTCKWNWNASNKQWDLVDQNCAGPTTTTTTTTSTTTTSTTSGGATTTTSEPCICGSRPTTTTTSPPCACVPPQYCGGGGCNSAINDCIPSVGIMPGQPTNCNPSSSSTTCTTVKCGTGCEWLWNGAGWDLQKFNCGPPCLPCDQPNHSGSGACTRETTGCGSGNTTTTPAPNCQGVCWWVWDTGTGEWWVHTIQSQQTGPSRYCSGCCYSDNCAPINCDGCKCYAPSSDGTSCGQLASTPCQMVSFSTTTPPCGVTTTTACGNQSCTWTWTGTDWALATSTCPSTCPCNQKPAGVGSIPGQCAFTKCGTTSSTTTTTTTTTTTSTTTTATTTTSTSTTSTTTTSHTTTTSTTTTSTTSTSFTTTTQACNGFVHYVCGLNFTWQFTSWTCGGSCPPGQNCLDSGIAGTPCGQFGQSLDRNCRCVTF